MPKVGKCELIYLQPRPRYYELSTYPAVTGCNTPILQDLIDKFLFSCYQ